LGYRDSWRSGKFYGQQVDLIFDLLEKYFRRNTKKLEEYLIVCERLGKTPDPNKMPVNMGIFPYEVQLAFLLHNLMPDRWEGMSGSYLGKDWSPVDALLKAYKIKDAITVLFFLKVVDNLNSKILNEDLEERRKKEEKKGMNPGKMNFPKNT
tara:strand:+ start:12 stop:467 length:456 start_codon:yes stop_codon:yes gene_type:complete